MPLDMMQKYDWTGVEAKLVYSIPEYPRTDDPSASGMAMLNRIVKDQYKKFLFGDISIEYQVREKRPMSIISFRDRRLERLKGNGWMILGKLLLGSYQITLRITTRNEHHPKSLMTMI